MREKIRILEGIYGAGSDAQASTNDDHHGVNNGDTSVDADTTRTGDKSNSEFGTHPHASRTDRRFAPQHGSRGNVENDTAVAGKDEGEDMTGSRDEDPQSGSQRTGSKNSGSDVEAVGDHDDAEKGRLAEGGEVAGVEAGVDEWLISYNRRLKSELERLRVRAREAEDR